MIPSHDRNLVPRPATAALELAIVIADPHDMRPIPLDGYFPTIPRDEAAADLISRSNRDEESLDMIQWKEATKLGKRDFQQISRRPTGACSTLERNLISNEPSLRGRLLRSLALNSHLSLLEKSSHQKSLKLACGEQHRAEIRFKGFDVDQWIEKAEVFNVVSKCPMPNDPVQRTLRGT